MRITACLVLVTLAGAARAQEAGNSAYGGTRRNTSGVVTGNLASVDAKDSVPSYSIEANVVMNVKADEYLAVFGLAQEGTTVSESQKRMDAQIEDFRRSLAGLGLKDGDVFVDYISQSRVYDVSLVGNTAQERLTGFQVKENVAIRYKDRTRLESILAAASKASIFDLVKVDYVVSDMAAVRERLLEEAAKVVTRKQEAYARLLGVKLKTAAVVQEKYNAFFPSEMYGAYVAYETGGVEAGNDVRVVAKRKPSTYYFKPLHPGEFDLVINSLGPEPVVQCTLFLKVKVSPVS